MWADQVYGPLPVAAPQLAATAHGEPARATVAPSGPAQQRVAAGEPFGGDPVLVWVVLLGIAIALGWVSFTLDVGR